MVISAGDDVASDAVVSSVALDLGLVAVEVLPGLVDDVSVLDLGEDKALLLAAGGQLGRPGSVGLADDDGKSGSLVARVALVPDDGAVVQAAAGQQVGGGVLNIRKRRTLRGCGTRQRSSINSGQKTIDPRLAPRKNIFHQLTANFCKVIVRWAK